jgi:uncharacterized membrane protein YfcA
MERKSLSIPEIGLIAGTRAALGAGLGLLLADRLSDEQRRAVGWTLLLVGALTTIPIGAELFHSGRARNAVPTRMSEGTPAGVGEAI